MLFRSDCVCPECPTCGEIGDPACYAEDGHGLVRSPEQVAAREAADERAAQIDAMYDAWAKSFPED